jgi:gamma-glutamylcysteine synthetase
MAGVTRVKGLDGLRAALARDLPLLRKKVHAAAVTAAVDAAHAAVAKVPIAFGELRSSIHVVATEPDRVRSIADAPHAAAAEQGSRPHWVPLDALIKWVKLRGMQGLSKAGVVRPSKGPGSTTHEHSFAIASQIKAAEKGGANDVDEPKRIALAIQAAIAKRGTRPHWFYRQARPIAMKSLDRAIREVLGK